MRGCSEGQRKDSRINGTWVPDGAKDLLKSLWILDWVFQNRDLETKTRVQAVYLEGNPRKRK